MIKIRSDFLLVLASASIACACSPTGLGSPDDTPVLEAIHFSQPVNLQVSLNSSAPPTNIQAALSRAGYISAAPYSNGDPWWHFNLNDGQLANNNTDAIVNMGERQIINRSEQRSWSDNSIQYFSETINYKIVIAPRLKVASVGDIGPFSIRIVMVNDPSIGHWTLQNDPLDASETMPAAPENDAVMTQLNNLGLASAAAFRGQIVESIQDSYHQVAAAILQQSGLQPKNTDLGVLVASSRHLAYLKDVSDLPDGAVFADAKSYCANLKRDDLAWRLATFEEVNEVAPQVNGSTRMDSPDGQIWGLAQGKKFIVDTFSTYAGQVADHPPGETSSGMGALVNRRVFYLQPGGIVTSGEEYSDNYSYSIDQEKVAWISTPNGGTGARPMCVATMQ